MAMNAGRTFRLNGLAVGAIVATVVCFGAAPAFAQPGGLFQKPHVLFIQQDKVVTFDVTPPNAEQPLGGGIGSQVGTATGAINGTSVLNFKFTFTSNPFQLPLTISFDNRAGITDTDGDQIIFRYTGTGLFNLPLVDPTVGGFPGLAPFQVFGNGIGGPLSGTYEVVAASGKYAAKFKVGQTFPVREIAYNPASPPTPPGTTGSAYIEVFEK